MTELFCDNTILISTSVIETLGLHVIEGIKNGVITIAPDEEYANTVYGENMFKYELFNKDAKEVVDVQSLNMNQQEAEKYFRRYKRFEGKQDFERLYEIRQRKHDITTDSIF